MILYEALRSTKAFATSEKNYELVRELVQFFRLKVQIEQLDSELIKGEELLIVLDGQKDSELEKEIRPGFEIDEFGEGYIYLKSRKFLFSFLEFVMNDKGKNKLISGSVFIPFNPAFDQLRTAYDYFLTQEGRVTDGLDREKYIDQLARQGVTDVEVNGLGYPMALENGLKGETYPMFYTYCPAMDQFVYSELNKGIYPYYYLSQNLEYLKQNAVWAVKRGLKPGMLSFEPRSVPEAFFQRYPMLRGARIDHPFRSFIPRYNMTITHPRVLNHYWEMTQKLLFEVPELSFFTIWSNDSGAGYEHTKSLYVGRNGGPYLIREWKDDQEISRLAGENVIKFMNNILEAGREINPDFRVITRLESFYGEHDVMWDGLKDGLDVEACSLVSKGWDMPYSHARYPDSKVLNGYGLHHQGFDEKEGLNYHELGARDSKASFYFGMGPQVMFAPLMGIPFPNSVWNRLKTFKESKIRDLVVYGGTFPKDKVPYFINHELIRRFQFESDQNGDSIIFEIAKNWVGDDAETLVEAWRLIEDAAMNFPNVSTLYNTIGFAWYRLWTRPLIPDLEAVTDSERAYYEDMMCTTPHNPNNVDLAKDVLFDIASIDHCGSAVGLIDENVIPVLDKAIKLLESKVDQNEKSSKVFYDQLVRVKGLRCYLITHRNIAAWIMGVHGYLEAEDIEQKGISRQILDDMMDLEIGNMDALFDLFEEDIEFIALMETGESPLMYGKNIQNQLRLKQELMRKYRGTEPRIDPDYMMRKAGTLLK